MHKTLLGVKGGSSPRLWGTHRPRQRQQFPSRFIPTPVGNTPMSQNPERRPPVHPHACGEHSHTPTDEINTAGSSPRLWGTLDAANTKLTNLRFIPTPVGNTVH